MSGTVLLLHGLMMRRPALLPMAWRLRGQGFRTALFTYSTLWVSPEAAIARVAERMRSLGDGPVHLLAHSLGGLIAVEALKRYPDMPAGRLICLGSPLAGSAAARPARARRGPTRRCPPR